MKQVIIIPLLASLTAGGPIAGRQQDGLDATALGQSWIQQIEDFATADKNVAPEVKNALISGLPECSLLSIGPIYQGGVPGYRADCPGVIDIKYDIVAVNATALGEAWIAAARRALNPYESPQSGQNAINSITKCSVERSPVAKFAADSFDVSCPRMDSDGERNKAEKKDEGNSPIEDSGSLPTNF